MNYRHAFHAGNFADVVKHAVLARMVAHLRTKAQPFRVIDSHAGAGLYNLAGPQARRSGEWRDGIGRLWTAALAGPVADLLAPYLDALRACNPGGKLNHYPGSPMLLRAWLRRQDRLIACEIEPAAAAALARNLRGDARVKTVAIDGWTALSAYIPPKERRGLMLIDPPFEQKDEFARLAQALAAAPRKWSTGLYLAWYPIKQAREAAAFTRKLARSGIEKLLCAEVTLLAPGATAKLSGTGLIAVNPPWKLKAERDILLPALAEILQSGGKTGVRLDWLVGKSG